MKAIFRTIDRTIRKVSELATTTTYFVFSQLVVGLVLVVGWYFSWKLFMRPLDDTSTVTNVAFGISATLAALCFSCARAIREPEEDIDRFTFAGERFLHAGILLISASVLKYSSLEFGIAAWMNDAGVPSATWWQTALKSIPGIVVGVLFLWAVISAHGGLVIVNRLLWKRHHRYPDWDSFW
jgi:hypothetical protein